MKTSYSDMDSLWGSCGAKPMVTQAMSCKNQSHSLLFTEHEKLSPDGSLREQRDDIDTSE